MKRESVVADESRNTNHESRGENSGVECADRTSSLRAACVGEGFTPSRNDRLWRRDGINPTPITSRQDVHNAQAMPSQSKGLEKLQPTLNLPELAPAFGEVGIANLESAKGG